MTEFYYQTGQASNTETFRYTASRETGTINTVETLGISTSKVAELQHESAVEVTDTELGTVKLSLGIICGVAVTVTCLLSSLLYPVVRLWLRRTEEEEEEDQPGGGGEVRQAFTVYDKVDLLLPAQYSDSSLETTATSATTGSLCQSVRSHRSQGQGETHRESIL